VRFLLTLLITLLVLGSNTMAADDVYWQFISPEATTNLVNNPSFEDSADGWTAIAGAIAQTADEQAVGLYSGEVTPAAGVDDGVYFAITLAVDTEYTFSVSVKGVD
jgi:hypothetical protein